MTVDQFAESHRSAAHNGPEEFVVIQFRRQGLYECWREEEVGKGSRWWGAGVVPVSSSRFNPAKQ